VSQNPLSHKKENKNKKKNHPKTEAGPGYLEMPHITSIDRNTHLNTCRKTFHPNEIFAIVLNSLNCQLLPILLDQQLEKYSCLPPLPWFWPKITEY